METNNTIKNQIKVLSEEQRVLKNQRKTIHLHGERIMDPWQAFFTHQANRSKLRELYFAYGLIKGRPLEVVQSQFKVYINMDNVNKLVEVYGKVTRSSQ